jgi:hypothetical protein
MKCDAVTGICIFCNKPTTQPDGSFFVVDGERRYTHYGCMERKAEEVVQSGEFDDLKITLSLPDGTTKTTTGKQVRMSAPSPHKPGSA